MNYQGVVWQEIFLERQHINAAPQRSPLNQGKQLWQGLENYILNSTRTHGFKACVFTAPVYTDGGERSRATGALEDAGDGR